MKSSLRLLFLLHQTLQLALCIGSGGALLASSKPRFVRRTARWWSVIHHSRECVSTAPESNGSELYTTVYGGPKLVCGCSAMETHFMKLPTNSYCVDVASRGSSELTVATEDRLFLLATCLSTRWSRSVSLRGLPLCGWAVVAPRCFHVTIMALSWQEQL